MSRARLILIIVPIVIVVVVAVIAFNIGLSIQKTNENGNAPRLTSDTIGTEVREIAEYAILDYRYTNVGQFENQLDFYGWKVPFTGKSFIITYDGAIKLGVESDKIKVNMNDSKININLPQIVILSHEIFESSIEVLDQTHNIFNQIEVEDYARFASDRKQDMESKIQNSDLYKQAEEKLIAQLTAILESMPGVKDHYEINFV